MLESGTTFVTPTNKAKAANGGRLPAGSVVCCNGEITECNWSGDQENGGGPGSAPGEASGFAIYSSCIDVHEAVHRSHMQPGSCRGKDDGDPPNFKPGFNKRKSERLAHRAEIDCLNDRISSCDYSPDPERCREIVGGAIRDACLELAGWGVSYWPCAASYAVALLTFQGIPKY